jgi:hypothetical protein
VFPAIEKRLRKEGEKQCKEKKKKIKKKKNLNIKI